VKLGRHTPQHCSVLSTTKSDRCVHLSVRKIILAYRHRGRGRASAKRGPQEARHGQQRQDGSARAARSGQGAKANATTGRLLRRPGAPAKRRWRPSPKSWKRAACGPPAGRDHWDAKQVAADRAAACWSIINISSDSVIDITAFRSRGAITPRAEGLDVRTVGYRSPPSGRTWENGCEPA